jgi:hypothetical protein
LEKVRDARSMRQITSEASGDGLEMHIVLLLRARTL